MRGTGWALFSLLLVDRTPPVNNEPLPPAPVSTRPPPSATWTAQSTRVSATAVSLRALGAKTHANWIFFRLPFDTTDRARIRSASFTPHASRDTNVGAFRVGGVCVTMPSSGPVDAWALYTTSGIGWTERFSSHGAAPTFDPTILAINVPTRVANHVACGRDYELLRPETWTLDISWEER
jgi:hypothetical protein